MSEFIGTVLFLMFALGGCNVANVPADTSSSTAINVTSGTNVSILLYISLCFGFSLTVNAWVFFRISGGLFNPAVSFALCLIGAITPLRMALLTLAQLLGGITAAAIVDSLSPGSLNVSVALSQGTSITQGLFLEMFLTIMLVFTIIMLAAEKHKATFIAPVGIGLALFIAHLWGVNWTGCGANPARALGPAITNRSFEGYFWIYFAGPYMGGAVSAFFYWVNKKLKFEEVNPELNRVLDERLEEGNLIITGNNHQ
ncbi:aquaporin-1 [Protomyces lactucae-debilis]|uniref:Aquaporin-1 n=1 Tax=Protomyces lactucae-debilis TaxID=2754530 RepID=A0A1Y2FDF8_PROLT|nr:aquaporin-1 [Protomyces lactucae-debilis]ORY81958.1 aquaporin-1 [Protomyces lactucae-debilis]